MGARRRAHEPERTCVACKRTRAKHELLRVVRAGDGRVRLDPTGSAPGRGAYVCPNERCTSIAGRKLATALKVKGDFGRLFERDG